MELNGFPSGPEVLMRDLVAVLYDALQSQEHLALFLSDAEQAGDQECMEFFREVLSQHSRQAERAKELLGDKLK